MDAPAGDPGPQAPAERRDAALAALYDRFGPALFRTARTLLGDDGLAEDAVQDTFLGLVRSAAPLADVANVRAYLFAALRHAAAKLRARGLAARPRPEPPAGLRARVLAAARRQWAVPRVPADRRDFGRFAAATAAAVLLAINLSASLANNTDWHLRLPAEGPDATANRIREL